MLCNDVFVFFVCNEFVVHTVAQYVHQWAKGKIRGGSGNFAFTLFFPVGKRLEETVLWCQTSVILPCVHQTEDKARSYISQCVLQHSSLVPFSPLFCPLHLRLSYVNHSKALVALDGYRVITNNILLTRTARRLKGAHGSVLEGRPNSAREIGRGRLMGLHSMASV
jgi:hypothetical protein